MNDTIVTVTMPDGYPLNVKLSEPDTASRAVVLFVQSSGPHTYDDERELNGSHFNCFDLFADELTRRGAAFCRYSTRGVYPGSEPPMYVKIDEAEYKTYLPSNTTDDIVRLTEWLRGRGYEKISLLGWSEGSVIAPLAVKRGARVDQLLLAGYLGCNLYDILRWQLSGNSSCIFYRRIFLRRMFKTDRSRRNDNIPRLNIQIYAAARPRTNKRVRSDIMQFFHRYGRRRSADTRRTDRDLFPQQRARINIVFPILCNMHRIIK